MQGLDQEQLHHQQQQHHDDYILSIVVPQFVQPVFEFVRWFWLYGMSIYQYTTSILLQLREMSISSLFYYGNRNGTMDDDNGNTGNNDTGTGASSNMSSIVFPIIAILLIFWPLLLSLIMAFLYSSAWFFWITTSMIIGSIQVIYASYQFLMISIDLLGLSMLKTYSVLRHTALYYVDVVLVATTTSSSSTSTRRVRLRKSRRRLWREMLESAGTYENFLKLRIEPKDVSISTTLSSTTGNFIRTNSTKNDKRTNNINNISNSNNNNSSNNKNNTDAALPALFRGDSPTSNSTAIRRVNSFSSSSPSSSTKRTGGTSSSSSTNAIARPLKSTPVSLLLHQQQHQILDDDLVHVDDDLLQYNDRFHNSTSDDDNKNIDFDSSDGSSTVKPRRNLSFTCGDKSPFDKFNEQILSLDPIIVQELGPKISDLLVTTMARLKEARIEAAQDAEADADTDADRGSGRGNGYFSGAAVMTLKYLLSAVVKRNHLTLDDILIENARSVAESGQYGLSNQSRHLIRAYYEEVQKSLDYIADAPLLSSNTSNNNSNNNMKNFNNSYSSVNGNNNNNNGNILKCQSELGDRITLIRKMKQNMGRTALMLSGGGAQAMYHLGVIRALIESKLYDDLTVISGTSGGSITAAMCAMKTAEELYNDVCVPTVSTDFGKDGRQKALNIRWFPSIFDMITYWMKHRLVVDSTEFGRTCEFYYGTTTFEEAFVRTGKHVCITVSASREHASSSSSAQRLLLNHISTPNVTIASAVRASCALPGVMAPAKLMVKNSYGELEPFEVDGVEWIDGSVQADLPFERISTLFAVTSFIVSQTNFHIVPFINKNHHPNQKSLYWSLFQTMEWDIRNRALKLSRLGLFPRIFGQDISKVFKQKYHGNLTIVPRFTTMQTFGLKILSNPTVKDMEGYLKYSQIAIWPYLNVIREMTRLEKSLDDCLARLEARMRALTPSDNTDWSQSHYNDDVESIASGAASATLLSTTRNVRIAEQVATTCSSSGSHVPYRRNSSSIGGGGGGGDFVDSDRIRERISGLEHENENLRKELERLRSMVVVVGDGSRSNINANDHLDEGNKNIIVVKDSNIHQENLVDDDDDDDDDIQEVTCDGKKKPHGEEYNNVDDDDETNDGTPSLADGSEGLVWKHIVTVSGSATDAKR